MITFMLHIKMAEKRINQKELCALTGINKNTMSSYFNGTAKHIVVDHLDKICTILDCDISDLIKNEPDLDTLLNQYRYFPSSELKNRVREYMKKERPEISDEVFEDIMTKVPYASKINIKGTEMSIEFNPFVPQRLNIEED